MHTECPRFAQIPYKYFGVYLVSIKFIVMLKVNFGKTDCLALGFCILLPVRIVELTRSSRRYDD